MQEPVQVPEQVAETIDASEVEITEHQSVPLPTVESDDADGPQSVTEAIVKATNDGFEEMQAAGDELQEDVPLPTAVNLNQHQRKPFQNLNQKNLNQRLRLNSEPSFLNSLLKG